jgi:hypothetical protein
MRSSSSWGRVPALRLELQISRLPGKGGYSTRPSGTTSSLVIWVESEGCIRHILPPYGERVGSTAGRGERGCEDRREGGRKLGVEDVASETEEAKAA